MNRIDQQFIQLKKQGNKAFIGFITAGYPSLSKTKDLIIELSAKGVDIIEVGIPFSDPLADGKTIQHASERALAKGITLKKILDMVAEVRTQVDTPIVFMGYANPFIPMVLAN